MLELTDSERAVLHAYRNPSASDMRRAVRLSVQYVIGSGVFVVLAIEQSPWWAIVPYAVFVAFMAIRLVKARRLAGTMPRIIAKYEARIAALEAAQASRAAN